MQGGASEMPDISAAVRSHLADLLASEEFAGSERRRDLLRFVVEETLSGRGEPLKAYTIGTKALGRAPGFDPQTDPIVRVEVGRLRATLDRYYRSHPQCTVVISIPKGRYRAEFGVDRPAPRSSSGSALVALQPFVPHAAPESALAAALTESTLAILTSAGIRTRISNSGQQAPFVLAGTVRSSGERLRVVATLTASGTADPMWTRRIDRDLDGTHEFELADDVAARIAWPLADTFGVLAPAIPDLAPSPIARYRNSYESLSVDTHRQVGSLLDATLAADPVDARTRAAMSDVLFTAWWLDLDPPAGALDRAEDLAAASIALDPAAPDGHLSAAYVHYARGRTRLFELELEAALERSADSPHLLVASGLLRVLADDADRGVELIRRGVDLNPNQPAWWHVGTCIAAVADGDLEAALVEANQIGCSAAHLGPFLRLALKTMLGHGDTAGDAKALFEFDERYGDHLDERLARVIRIDAVRERLVAAVRTSGALPITG